MPGNVKFGKRLVADLSTGARLPPSGIYLAHPDPAGATAAVSWGDKSI